jgi:uroporphyrinogen-III synthase
VTVLPLEGRTVVVTRTRAQASALADQLSGLGAEVVALPVIAVVDPIDGGEALGRAADRLVSGGYEWVVCTSANAVTRLTARLGDRVVPTTTRWAAVGTGTARALTEAGRPVDLVPEVSTADELAVSFPARSGDAGAGGRAGALLFPRAETVRGTLGAALGAKGWLVDEVVTYRTVVGDPSAGALDRAARADAVAFTSSSTVERALELLGPHRLPRVVVTIGPVTTATARAAGLLVAAEAQPHTIGGLVEAVVAALSGQGVGDLP